jgi:hypothetical protein
MGPVLPQVETRPSGDNLHDLVESISGRVKLKALFPAKLYLDNGI